MSSLEQHRYYGGRLKHFTTEAGLDGMIKRPTSGPNLKAKEEAKAWDALKL